MVWKLGLVYKVLLGSKQRFIGIKCPHLKVTILELFGHCLISELSSLTEAKKYSLKTYSLPYTECAIRCPIQFFLY